MQQTRKLLALLLVLVAFLCVSQGQGNNPQKASPQRTGAEKPNILFIMGDDIGWMQPSIYHRGLMVGETPNIDRIGHEGATFMDMSPCRAARPDAMHSSPACIRCARA